LPECGFSPISKRLEVRFTPEAEEKRKGLYAQSGRAADDLVEDGMAGYFDEVLKTPEPLSSRYDDPRRMGYPQIGCLNRDLLETELSSEAYPDFLPQRAGKFRVCAFP
jgi:hypothetical protein